MKSKIKYFVGTFAACCCLATLFFIKTTYAASATLYLNPSSGTFSKNETFNLAVLENSSDEPVNAVEAVLQYPTDKLDLVDVDYEGSVFSIGPPTSSGNGTVHIIRATTSTDVKGAQFVANIKFKVKATGLAAINFTNESRVLSTNGNTDILRGNTKSGKYTLVSQAASTKKKRSASSASITGSEANKSSPTNRSNNPANEAYFTVKDDFNDSGHVDIFDLTLLLEYCFSGVLKYDLNSDGIVNNVDISILLRNYGK